MSRRDSQVSSRRSRGSSHSLGSSHGGNDISYSHEVKEATMSDSSGRMIRMRQETTHIKVSSSADSYHIHQPLRTIREDRYGSDSEDEDIGGRFSKMSIAGGGRDRTSSRASQATIRGPRIQEITDADVERMSSRYGGSRQSTSRQPSSRSSGTTDLRSRPTDRIPTSRAIEYPAHCSRPSESRHDSIRPSESRYTGSSRPSESRHDSTRPSESRYTGSSRRNTLRDERNVYADRDSRDGCTRYGREHQSSRG